MDFLKFEDLMTQRILSSRKSKTRAKSVILKKEPTFKLIVEVPAVAKMESLMLRSKSTENEELKVPLVYSKNRLPGLYYNHLEKPRKSACIASPYLFDTKLKQFSSQH